LYALVALRESEDLLRALLFVLVELLAAGIVSGYVLLLRRRRRVGGFWLPERAERLVPALVLLATFAALLASLALLRVPESLFGTTLSMGLAAAAVAAVTLFWKASAHAAVVGHAAVAGLLVLGPLGLVFAPILPAVLWSRVTTGAHTPAQALVGGAIGVAFAAAFLA
jgi:hypothetical protein